MLLLYHLITLSESFLSKYVLLLAQTSVCSRANRNEIMHIIFFLQKYEAGSNLKGSAHVPFLTSVSKTCYKNPLKRDSTQPACTAHSTSSKLLVSGAWCFNVPVTAHVQHFFYTLKPGRTTYSPYLALRTARYVSEAGWWLFRQFQGAYLGCVVTEQKAQQKTQSGKSYLVFQMAILISLLLSIVKTAQQA